MQNFLEGHLVSYTWFCCSNLPHGLRRTLLIEVRLSDTPGDKAGNPVVSPDGATMAFSLGKAADNPPGAGYGLFLLKVNDS